MSGYSVGPLPSETFLDLFLPVKASHTPKIRKGTFKETVSNLRYRDYDDIEDDGASDSFVSALNNHNFCPGYVFAPCVPSADDERDSPSELDSFPTVAGYSASISSRDWFSMELFVQLKVKKRFDPYRSNLLDKNDSLEGSSEDSYRTLQQLFRFAASQMGYQSRLFLFVVGIYGTTARFFRFDTSAVIVSANFDYTKRPGLLAEFFLRYSSLSPSGRGLDPTVSLATSVEKRLFFAHIKRYLSRTKAKNLRRYPRVENIGREDAPIFKMQVNDADGSLRWFLVCKPSYIPINSSPCGKFTRGFIAVPLPATSEPMANSGSTARTTLRSAVSENGKLYWLKDSWRPTDREPELAIYRRLQETKVGHLPEIICGGDVAVDSVTQETENDRLLVDSNSSWRRPAPAVRHRVHHRIVQGLLIPLWHAETTKDLLRAGRDALETIADAFHGARLLHQDISIGNVMLTEERSNGTRPTGILNDWDRAQELGSLTCDHRRGTWQFLSVDLLRDGDKPHEVLDDVESLLWVLLYVAAKHFGYEGESLEEVFDEVYRDPNGPTNQEPTGGGSKGLWLSGWIAGRFRCSTLQQFFRSLRRVMEERRQKYKQLYDLGTEETQTSLRQYTENREKDLYMLLVYFDDVLDNPTLPWGERESTPLEEPDTADEFVAKIVANHVQLVPTRGKKRRRDPAEHQNDPRSEKRQATTHPDDDVTEPAAVSRPSRRRRAAPVLPRKVYNLRPRKKPQ